MKKSLYISLGLHFFVAILLTINIPLFWGSKKTTISQVPIIVDLKDIKISEITNLPPKAKVGKEDRQASTEKRKANENYTTPTPKQKDEPSVKEDPKAETTVDTKEQAKPVEGDYLEAPKAGKGKPKKYAKPSRKPSPPKTPDTRKAAKPNESSTLANPLKSLLASVDSIEKSIGQGNQSATIKEGTEVNNMGIEGGTGGSYFSELSISEIDAISGRLRACWNVDPGAKGAQNMIVEIRAFLKQDGSVSDVKILDASRYNSDPHFRSVADSARRAVYICAPYKIFAEKYQNRYDSWKTMLLRFNPLDGNVN